MVGRTSSSTTGDDVGHSYYLRHHLQRRCFESCVCSVEMAKAVIVPEDIGVDEVGLPALGLCVVQCLCRDCIRVLLE